jgi:hypothetical protein
MNYVLKIIRGAQSTVHTSPVPITLCSQIADVRAMYEMETVAIFQFIRRSIDRKLRSKRARWADTKVYYPTAFSTRVTAVATTNLKGFG